jgi:hypothetical protein
VCPCCRTRREIIKTIATLTAALAFAGASAEQGKAKRPILPTWWLQQAACIRSHEGWWTANTGNGFYGAYQFMLSTWRAVGGSGYPHQASPEEQTWRAYLNWKANGQRWGNGQWPSSARACGFR